jgi:hypothetical protein
MNKRLLISSTLIATAASTFANWNDTDAGHAYRKAHQAYYAGINSPTAQRQRQLQIDGTPSKAVAAKTAVEIAQNEGTVSPKKFQAEMLRSALGSTLDDREFSQGTIQLNKGDVFLVEEQTYSDVVLAKSGKRFKVAKNEVRLTEVNPSTETEVYGESIRILSAKYGRPNNRQYEVRDEIRKRLPKGPLTDPVQILVTDALLRSRARYMTQTGVLQGNIVIMQKDEPCMLTITYEHNRQSFKKEVLEGNTLVLP